MFSRVKILVIIAAIPLCAWCMYMALRFLLVTTAPDFLPAYSRWAHVAQILAAMFIASVLISFGQLRMYCTTECHKVLGSPLPRRFFLLYFYAVLCWMIPAGYLLYRLWCIPAHYDLAVILQLLLLSAGICIMMGIAVPVAAIRFAGLLWYERLLRRMSRKENRI